VWIHPDVVAEITYAELMQGRLRDAVLRSAQPITYSHGQSTELRLRTKRARSMRRISNGVKSWASAWDKAGLAVVEGAGPSATRHNFTAAGPHEHRSR
jgi:hypothetical protein